MLYSKQVPGLSCINGQFHIDNLFKSNRTLNESWLPSLRFFDRAGQWLRAPHGGSIEPCFRQGSNTNLPRLFWSIFGSQKQLTGQEESKSSPQSRSTGEHPHTQSLDPYGCVPGPCWQVVQDRAPMPVSISLHAQGGRGAVLTSFTPLSPAPRVRIGKSASLPLSSDHLGWCTPA